MATYQGIPKEETAKIVKYPAIIKISPWAKFIRRKIPYTMVYPMAINAYADPRDTPVTTF